MKYKNILLLSLGVVLGFIFANTKSLLTNNSTITKPSSPTLEPVPSIFNESLNNYSIVKSEDKPQLVNLSENESKNVVKEIDAFEKYNYLKNPELAIRMITSPANKDEQSWLDYYLGNDMKDIAQDKPTSRFLLRVNFHFLLGYQIVKISKTNNQFYASVKELRVINVKDGVQDYRVVAQDLTFELINTDDSCKISRYYHDKPTNTSNLKYEGFVAY